MSSVVGSGSLLTGQSGSPLVESELDNDNFGLLSGFGVPGPFTFRLQEKKMTICYGNQITKHLLCRTTKTEKDRQHRSILTISW